MMEPPPPLDERDYAEDPAYMEMALGGSDTDESEQSGELGRGAFRMTGSHSGSLRRRNTAKRDAAMAGADPSGPPSTSSSKSSF